MDTPDPNRAEEPQEKPRSSSLQHESSTATEAQPQAATASVPTAFVSDSSTCSDSDWLIQDPAPGAAQITDWLAAQEVSSEFLFSDNNGAIPNEEEIPTVSVNPTSILSYHAEVEEFLGVNKNLRRQLRRLKRHKHEELEKTEQQQQQQPAHSPHYDTLSYHQPDQPVWHYFVHQVRSNKPSFVRRLVACTIWNRHKGTWESGVRDARLVGNVMLVVIALVMSVVGFLISLTSGKLLTWKLDQATSRYLQHDTLDHDDDRNVMGGFGFFLGFNVLFGFLATLPVLIRPLSAGSGIAEAKAVLNGIILPQCTSLSTALAKAISVTFSAAASLPIGLEGPMIFIGLALGDNAEYFLPPQWFPLATEITKVSQFRKDIQAVGTACGVTSAFHKPIGGVLFAMEEGCSYWNNGLTFSSFLAACLTAIFTYLWNILSDTGKYQGQPLPDYVLSKFQGLPAANGSWESSARQVWISFRMVDYFAFACMGIAGGIIGACWCEVNRYISIGRARLKYNKVAKVREVLFLVVITSCILWWLPVIFPECTTYQTVESQNYLVNRASQKYYKDVGCPEGAYNHLATLFWNPTGGVGINLLFWEPSIAFSASSCAIAGTTYLLLLLILFGTSISMGIFIPLLYVGACYGRAVALSVDPISNIPNLVNTYAIVGSVAMLAGVARVFISLSVIMITATGQPHLVTPFMVTALCARLAGKVTFNRQGIYDIILQLKHIPFLEEVPFKRIAHQGLTANDIMSPLLFTVEPETTVGTLVDGLKRFTYLDIPVVDSALDGDMLGTVSRTNILKVLSRKELFYKSGDNVFKAMKFETLNRRCSKLTLGSIESSLTEDDLQLTVDLSAYIHVATPTLHLRASADRCYTVFRTLGLRSLIVTDIHGKPVGLITRDDLYLLEELAENDENEETMPKTKEQFPKGGFTSLS